MDFAADLPLMLDDFGEPVTLDGRPVTGIFDGGFEGHALGRAGEQGQGIDLERPVLTVSAADAEGVVPGALATVRGAEYAVVHVRPDGAGLVVELPLTKTSAGAMGTTWR